MATDRGDGARLVRGGWGRRGHVGEAEFEVFTHTGANSGVYFHTAWQDKGWPTQGFAMQVNNHQPRVPGDSGATYVENKKTGSASGSACPGGTCTRPATSPRAAPGRAPTPASCP